MMNKLIIIIPLILLLAAGAYVLYSRTTPTITSYEECVAAGNPVMESFPPQCSTPDGQTFTQQNLGTNSAQGAEPGTLHNLPVPTPVAKVKEQIAQKLDIDANQVVVMSVIDREWPNGCLGLAQADELCTEALVPGYEVTAQAQEQFFTYRTDLEGNNVREAPVSE